MKPLKIDRFTKKKPEPISFEGTPMQDNPEISNEIRTNERSDERTNEKQPIPESMRTNERTNVRTEINKTPQVNERTNERSDGDNTPTNNAYSVIVPQNRRKIRHSFDIFEDQKNTLEKLQLAIAEKTNNKKPSLGDLIQEAIDLFAKQKAKEFKNILIKKESE